MCCDTFGSLWPEHNTTQQKTPCQTPDCLLLSPRPIWPVPVNRFECVHLRVIALQSTRIYKKNRTEQFDGRIENKQMSPSATASFRIWHMIRVESMIFVLRFRDAMTARTELKCLLIRVCVFYAESVVNGTAQQAQHPFANVNGSPPRKSRRSCVWTMMLRRKRRS